MPSSCSLLFRSPARLKDPSLLSKKMTLRRGSSLGSREHYYGRFRGKITCSASLPLDQRRNHHEGGVATSGAATASATAASTVSRAVAAFTAISIITATIVDHGRGGTSRTRTTSYHHYHDRDHRQRQRLRPKALRIQQSRQRSNGSISLVHLGGVTSRSIASHMG